MPTHYKEWNATIIKHSQILKKIEKINNNNNKIQWDLIWRDTVISEALNLSQSMANCYYYGKMLMLPFEL